MKRALLTLIALAAIGGSVYAYYHYRDTAPRFTITTAPVGRGDVIDTVGATGTLQAVTTVQVGTQVSGTIQSLYADFNSLVTKGQVLARLDPSLFQTQIAQARANLVRAQADLERLKVGLEDARTKVQRARELSGRNLIPKSELDTAEVNVRLAEAQIQSSEAQVTQAQASLNQNLVNLQHTVIEAPIDGLVISRSVDVGQTVAASMQAPTLFVLAADLTKMQVLANLDESDVGRIRPGQHVTFRVDAYPADDFTGSVSQVRLEPKVQQNVVTYATIIDVPHDQLKLKPGMTATVSIEIAKATDVLRIPNAALRFRPTPEIYAALGQAPPEPAGRGGRGVRANRQNPGSDAAATAPPLQAMAPAATAGARADAGDDARTGSSERKKGTEPAGTTPVTGDEGSAVPSADPGAARGRRGRGGLAPRMRGPTPEGRGGSPRSRPESPTGRPEAESLRASGGATTIDALFGPLPRQESGGTVYLMVDGKLSPVRVRLGITDSQMTQLVAGDVPQDAELVTNISLGSDARPAASGGFPFQPQRGFRGNRGGGPGRGR
jgi:HlyD family secretion protein